MHNWQNYDDKEHVFVNSRLMKYGVIKDDATFSRTGKSLWILIPAFLGLAVIIAVVAFTQTWWIGLIVAVPVIGIYQYIFRKFVMDENKRKRLMAENIKHQESGLEYFNNVLGADDDGEILFQQSDYGFSSGFLVTYNYGSLTENTENADRDFIDGTIRPFIRDLQDNGFRWKEYDIDLKSHLSKGTLNLIDQTKQMKDNTILKVVSQLQNEACASLERNNNVEYRVYYLILNDAMNSVKNFKESLETIINSTLGNSSQISSPHICDLNEINEFGRNYFNIASFDINHMNRNISNTNLGKYFIIDGFIDQNGIIHKPSELDFFPTQKERVMNPFNRTNLRDKLIKRKNIEKKHNIDKHNAQRSRRSQIMLNNYNRTKQNDLNRKNKLKQEQKAKEKKREMENKQRMQKNRAKSFNDILQKTRNQQK